MIQRVSIAKVDIEKLDSIVEAGKKIAACARSEHGNISYDIVQSFDCRTVGEMLSPICDVAVQCGA